MRLGDHLKKRGKGLYLGGMKRGTESETLCRLVTDVPPGKSGIVEGRGTQPRERHSFSLSETPKNTLSQPALGNGRLISGEGIQEKNTVTKPALNFGRTKIGTRAKDHAGGGERIAASAGNSSEERGMQQKGRGSLLLESKNGSNRGWSAAKIGVGGRGRVTKSGERTTGGLGKDKKKERETIR